MRYRPALLLFFMFIPAPMAFGTEAGEMAIRKECMILEDKSIEEAKKELLVSARRSAVEQLFGSLVTSLTQIEDLALKKDQIQSASMGYVRLKGDPAFFNGENIGELCVKIEAFATEEDRAKLRAKELSKKICVSEGDVATIIKRAEDKAILEALTNYDGNLRRLSPDKVLPLLHEVQFSDRGFIPETTTYCIRATGLLYPVEATAIGLQDSEKTEESSRSVSGLRGEYFNSPPFVQGEWPAFPARAEHLRIDKTINFNWGSGSPAPRISAQFFLVRWSGEIYAPVTGTYHFEFRLEERNGGRLLIGNEMVLEGWRVRFMGTLSSPGSYALATYQLPERSSVRSWIWYDWIKGDIYLEGKRWHRIEVEFFEERGTASVALAWRPPGERTSQIVPGANLRTRED